MLKSGRVFFPSKFRTKVLWFVCYLNLGQSLSALVFIYWFELTSINIVGRQELHACMRAKSIVRGRKDIRGIIFHEFN